MLSWSNREIRALNLLLLLKNNKKLNRIKGLLQLRTYSSNTISKIWVNFYFCYSKYQNVEKAFLLAMISSISEIEIVSYLFWRVKKKKRPCKITVGQRCCFYFLLKMMKVGIVILTFLSAAGASIQCNYSGIFQSVWMNKGDISLWM